MAADFQRVKQFQVRGVPGNVTRANFDGRFVDFWGPENPTHVLVTHDGQNIFDKNTATRRKTWQLAQHAVRLSDELGINPPLIISVFHSRTKSDPHGRYKDLTPQQPFLNGLKVNVQPPLFELEEIRSDAYLRTINEEILPSIANLFGLKPEARNTAMLGSSMGGLMTLYGVGLRPDIYGSALSLSPHWVISDNAFVDALIDALPKPGTHKLWMSRGTKGLDATYETQQNYADQRALENGWRANHDFISKVYPRTGHNEKSWSKYVSSALKFWLE